MFFWKLYNSNNSVAASISEEWAFEMASSILLSSRLQQLHQCISFWNCNDLASVLLPLDVCSSFVSSNVTLLHRCPVCLLRCRTLTLWPDFTLLRLYNRKFEWARLVDRRLQSRPNMSSLTPLNKQYRQFIIDCNWC